MRGFRSIGLVVALSACALADEPASRREVEGLRAEVAALKKALADQQAAFERSMSVLADRIEWVKVRQRGVPIAMEDAKPDEKPKEGESETDLEKEFEQAIKGAETPKPPAPVAQVGQLKLIDIAFDILTDAGTSTADEEELARLQFGDHDPKTRGVRVPNTELTLAGVVDPYFRGDAHVVFQIEPDGETSTELEEAYFTTTSLPKGLQVRGGQMFERFGRLNPQHPHAWDFVDMPVVSSRMFGPDGLRAPTAELSWLTPLPFFAEVTGAVLYARGDTAFSFLNEPGGTFSGHLLQERKVDSLEDLTYLLRLRTSHDLSDEWTIVDGVSALFGPNDASQEGNTQVYGGDVYLKWKPLDNDHGFPFVSLQTEAMGRRYETGDGLDAGGAPLDSETLLDWGVYAQVLWGFSRSWVLGARYDHAEGDSPLHDDFLRDRRDRGSVNLTYYPSEFSKIRLQANVDDADHLEGTDESVWIQVEILFGAHGAHQF